MMKKQWLFICLILMAISSAKAQELQFSPFAGYTFADKFKINRGSAKIGAGFTYGASLTYIVHKKTNLELTYSREDCNAWAYSEYHGIDVRGPLSVNYIFFGSSELLQLNEDLSLFIGPNVGLGIYSGKDNELGSTTQFAVGLSGGMKYMFSDKIGFRLQSHLNMPITNLDAGLWWNIGSGPSAGLTSHIPFLQFGFTGGLVFTLN